MKSVRSLQWALVMVALAMSGLPALADDDNYLGMPLTQARFDRLIPTSYPTIRPTFNRLIPTTLPLIQPGIARVHITENLVYPLSQPLLIVNERPESWAASLSQPPPTSGARSCGEQCLVVCRPRAESRSGRLASVSFKRIFDGGFAAPKM